jgi:hypothetical protein
MNPESLTPNPLPDPEHPIDKIFRETAEAFQAAYDKAYETDCRKIYAMLDAECEELPIPTLYTGKVAWINPIPFIPEP